MDQVRGFFRHFFDLVEAATDIDQELYLGAVVDRATRRVIFMASTEGGGPV
jgi:succinyl-CoA synthetase beta subunit